MCLFIVQVLHVPFVSITFVPFVSISVHIVLLLAIYWSFSFFPCIFVLLPPFSVLFVPLSRFFPLFLSVLIVLFSLSILQFFRRDKRDSDAPSLTELFFSISGFLVENCGKNSLIMLLNFPSTSRKLVLWTDIQESCHLVIWYRPSLNPFFLPSYSYVTIHFIIKDQRAW